MSITPLETSQKLHHAIALIEEVRATLNTSEVVCAHCQRTSRQNWSHAQMHKELGAVITKLLRADAQLAK